LVEKVAGFFLIGQTMLHERFEPLTELSKTSIRKNSRQRKLKAFQNFSTNDELRWNIKLFLLAGFQAKVHNNNTDAIHGGSQYYQLICSPETALE